MAVSVASFGQVTDWFSATTPKTVTSLSWNAGDEIVVVGGAETADTSVATPTNANLTFALETSQASGGSGEAAIFVWTAVAGSSQSSQTIQATATGGGWWGFGLWVCPGGSGSFANATADLTDSAFTFTPTADSLVIYAHMDWNATSGKTITAGTGTPTERVDSNGSNYGVYLGDWAGVTASSASFGISSYAGVQIARGRIEVLASASEASEAASSPVPLSFGTFSQPRLTPLLGLLGPPIPLQYWAGEDELPAAGPVIVDVEPVFEAEVIQPATITVIVNTGQTVEAEAAQPVTNRKLVQPGQTFEAEVTQPLVAPLGQVFEAEVIQPATMRKLVPAGQLVEAELAQPSTRSKIVRPGQMVETEVTQPSTRSKLVRPGQMVEAELAQPFTNRKIVRPGQTFEAEVVQPSIRSKIIKPGQVLEAEVIQAITNRKLVRLGQNLEAEVVQAVTLGAGATIINVGQVIEAETILPATMRKILRPGQIIEAELVPSTSNRKLVQLGLVLEAETIFEAGLGVPIVGEFTASFGEPRLVGAFGGPRLVGSFGASRLTGRFDR